MTKEFLCTQCGTATPSNKSQAIDLEWKVARCGSCHLLFDITSQLDDAGPETDAPGEKREKSVAHYSEAVTYTESDGAVALTCRWAQFHDAFTLCLTFLTMVPLLGFGLRIGWIGLILYGPFIGAAAMVFYYALIGQRNHTLITIAGGRLKTEHGPLWQTRITPENLPCANIESLEVRTKLYRSRGRTHTYYLLCAQLKNGNSVLLVPQLKDPEGLKYAQSVLQKHLASQGAGL